MKLDILAFGSHPDDVELGCGGTIAKSVAQGKSVGIIDLTRGELSTKGSVPTRHIEAQKAADILGVQCRLNMELEDGFISNDKKSKFKVIQKIRQYKPNIVLSTAHRDRHIDHQNSNQLIHDSCFLSGLKKIEIPDDRGESLTPWRPKIILEYIQWNDISPDIIIDISGYLDVKVLSIKAHKSQFFNTKNNTIVTPISKPNFLSSMEARAINFGRLIGTEAGEGYTSPQPLAIGDLNCLLF
ncbi:MAG: bacillithiol biosynthesis deacetylase BshB1 [Flavobacteriaceae bacterium]|nr:bacillithiol biosynthesis deacetylase BshB1 [Flavobacteriaceae bacterium]MCY4267974.1 bacillithiol biosynthesis deacetylase BshB1 [Flavobacteriaceae bacterium]